MSGYIKPAVKVTVDYDNNHMTKVKLNIWFDKYSLIFLKKRNKILEVLINYICAIF